MSRARDFADLASAYSGGALGNRNIIHNGNMAVHQRGGTITANGYSLDRWRILSGNLDNLAFEVTQAADAPATFTGSTGKSLKFQTKTVESALASDEEMRIASLIEAQNCQHLLYGGSSAKKFTVSFWVKSSLTGTFAVMMYMEDGALNIGSTYTISSADTWEHKTVTIVGNTSQAISKDNTIGFYIQWVLFAGSDYTSTDNTSWASYATGRLGYGHAQNGLATTDESTWQLTGVQMEVGEVATEFEHESYGDTLRKCQRYFLKIGPNPTEGYTRFQTGHCINSTSQQGVMHFPVSMRAAGTLTSLAAANYCVYHQATVTACTSISLSQGSNDTLSVYTQVSSGLTAGEGCSLLGNNNTTAYIAVNAEL